MLCNVNVWHLYTVFSLRQIQSSNKLPIIQLFVAITHSYEAIGHCYCIIKQTIHQKRHLSMYIWSKYEQQIPMSCASDCISIILLLKLANVNIKWIINNLIILYICRLLSANKLLLLPGKANSISNKHLTIWSRRNAASLSLHLIKLLVSVWFVMVKWITIWWYKLILISILFQILP